MEHVKLARNKHLFCLLRLSLVFIHFERSEFKLFQNSIRIVSVHPRFSMTEIAFLAALGGNMLSIHSYHILFLNSDGLNFRDTEICSNKKRGCELDVGAHIHEQILAFFSLILNYSCTVHKRTTTHFYIIVEL